MLDDWVDSIDYIRENPERYRELLIQHLELTVVAVLIGIAIALPLALLCSRIELLAKPLTWLASIGQTIPSLAVLGVTLPYLGIGFRPALFALTIRAILPIFLNAYVGIKGIDRAVIDAARGMGSNGFQILTMVQLPLAAPVIYAGIQTATVQTIAVATLAAYIGGGGFGDLILQGLAMMDEPVLLAGAVPVALMAILAEFGMRRLRRFVVPAGLRVDAAR
jgi:osmoprotectant transport system permease protein